MELGSKNSIAYVVKVAGKNMQPDFEPVIERKFHNYINCIEGVYHTGQRDMQRIRISIDAFNAGFKIKHIGEVLYASVKNEFDAVVDKCEVVIYTDPAECTRVRHEVAIPIFDKRDERLDTLTDESVDVYYSCILCQAFSPSHVCVVTPERLGLCGAVSWLDAKATHQLDPNGPCQYETYKPDIVLYDVLGDVVCGGFSMPMRKGYADKVFIITSGENMAIHAGANIAMAVQNFRNRGYAALGGIILNRRNVKREEEKVQELAEDFETKVIGKLIHSDLVTDAEEQGKTLMECYPESEMATEYRILAEQILNLCREDGLC